MHRLIKHRPSPAMVVACLALLVALTGTSVAAVQALAPNSVGTVQLKAGAVTTPKLKNASVTGGKVMNGSLTAADFAATSLPTGPKGDKGDKGDAGPAGTIGPIAVRQASIVVPGGTAHNAQYSTGTVTVPCNANEKAISAGTGWSDDAADRELWVQRLTPLLTGTNVTGYRATGGNDSGNTSTFTLYVLCYVG
jgi:hypothetical protein